MCLRADLTHSLLRTRRSGRKWLVRAEDAKKRRAASKGDFAKAAPLLEELAKGGDPVATYKLAKLYYRGLGVVQDDRSTAPIREEKTTAMLTVIALTLVAVVTRNLQLVPTIFRRSRFAMLPAFMQS